MRILLVNPPYIGWLNDIKVEPIGLLYIASFLRNLGHEVALWDRYIGETEEDFVQLMVSWQPRVVACAVYTVSEQFCFETAALARRIDPSITFIAGGPHASFTARRMLLKCPAIDVITIREAEESFAEIVRCVAEQRDFHDVRGVAFAVRTGSETTIVTNPFQNLQTPIDELPVPARDLLTDLYYEKYRATGVISARGCAYKCDFCVSPAFFKGVRKRRLSLVAEEIRTVASVRGLRHIRFYDDVFAYNLERVKEVRAVIGPLDMTFDCYIRIDSTTPEMIETLAQAGCVQVRFGVESGGDTARSLHKGGRSVPFAQHATIVEKCREVGIETLASYIIGFPEESEEDVLETIHFADRLNTDRVGFYKLTPYPGTIYWEMLDEDQVPLHDYTKFDNKVSVNPRMNSNEVFRLLRYAYEHYYRTRPPPSENPDTMRFLTSLPKLRY